MKVLFVICAEGAVTDRYTGATSLFNIIDKFSVLAFPLFIPRLVCVIALERTAEEPNEGVGKLEVSIGNAMLMAQESPFTFMGQNRTSLAAILHGMPIAQPGILHFRYSTGGVEGTYDVPFEQAAKEQMELFTQLASTRFSEISRQTSGQPTTESQTAV